MHKGDEVLVRLSFTDTIEEACFGLGMVLLAITSLAILLLHYSKLTYVSLGWTGANYKSRAKSGISSDGAGSSNEKLAAAAVAVVGASNTD